MLDAEVNSGTRSASGEQLGAGRRERNVSPRTVHLEPAAIDRELHASAVLGRAAAVSKQEGAH
jgi:hypothetical protein